jgi:hypothetical protein
MRLVAREVRDTIKATVIVKLRVPRHLATRSRKTIGAASRPPGLESDIREVVTSGER